MKKPVGMTILAFGTLLVGSCTAQTPQLQTSSIPSEVTAPEPTKKSSPITTAAINNDLRSRGGKVIHSTDPTVRLKQVVSGGRDPFAPVLVQPISIQQPRRTSPKQRENKPIQVVTQPSEMIVMKVTTPEETAPVQRGGKLPNLPPLPRIETARLPILTTPSLPPEARSAVTALGNGSPGTSLPEIAEAVKVSGVIELGSGKKAIVQVPGEKTQRYVAEGEWLGQGKVQVKRIELDEMGAPVVILSENGQEVVKMVGSTSNTIAGSFGWTN